MFVCLFICLFVREPRRASLRGEDASARAPVALAGRRRSARARLRAASERLCRERLSGQMQLLGVARGVPAAGLPISATRNPQKRRTTVSIAVWAHVHFDVWWARALRNKSYLYMCY